MRKRIAGYVVAFSLLFFSGCATATEQYRITEANPNGYPQSTWNNDAVVELTDPAQVERLAALLAEGEALAEPPKVDNFGHLSSYIISGDGMEMKLYYNTLYYATYLEKDGGFYDLGNDAGRYVVNLFELGGRDCFTIPQAHAELFQGYGWTLDFVIGTQRATLPTELVSDVFDENAMYFSYHDLFLRDAGFDIRPYLGQEITASMYYVHENVDRFKWSPGDAKKSVKVMIQMRGIVLSQGDAIIGAYLSAGRHNTRFACSLNGKSDQEILGDQSLLDYLLNIARLSDLEKELATLSPEEMLRRFCVAEGAQAAACFDRVALLCDLSANMPDNWLYMPVTEFDIAPGIPAENVDKLEIKDVSLDTYAVTFAEAPEEWGTNTFYPKVFFESEITGWKCNSFYNTGW